MCTCGCMCLHVDVYMYIYVHVYVYVHFAADSAVAVSNSIFESHKQGSLTRRLIVWHTERHIVASFRII